jgi:hypothetical protein
VLDSKYTLTAIQGSPWLFLSAFLACFLPFSNTARAQFRNQGQFQREMLITQGVGEETGNLAIYVSYPNWFGKPGYCPLRVRVVPRKGLSFKTDGQLKVSFGLGFYGSNYEPSRQVIVDIPIEAGTTEAVGEILGNFFSSHQVNRNEWLSVSARLDGRKLRGQGTSMYGIGGANSSFDCKYLTLISPESAKNESRRLDAIAEMEETGNWFSQESNQRFTGYSVAYANVHRMPTNWLYLSSLEGISIDYADLIQLDAKKLECINHYILSGGGITVNRVVSPSTVSDLLKIDLNKRFELQKGASKSGVSKFVPITANFQPPSLDPFENTLWDQYQRNRSTYYSANYRTFMRNPTYKESSFDSYRELELFGEDILEVGRTLLDSELSSASIFASHIYDSLPSGQPLATSDIKLPAHLEYGFGSVYLESKQKKDHFNAMEEMATSAGYRNPQLSYSASSNRTSRLSGGIGDDFWDWLIPSVGRTPAIPFLIFVVLFVGVGAPGIMYWSNRHKRRVWLVILMPLMATVCTLFLFSYGLLKDGFGAVSRSRSLAFIDKMGNGLVWSRQCYFCASVSNQGVMVSDETYFAPMPVNPYSDLPRCYQADVEDAQQYFGILRPRLQTQFSISHPLRHLQILKRLGDSDPVLDAPAIQNDSNFRWSKAVFVGHQNKFFTASNVEPGSRVEFALSDREASELLLQQEYKAQALVPPPDSPSADQTTLAQTFSSIFTWAKTGNATGQISEESNWAKQIGKAGNAKSALTPGTFVIFAAEAPYLEKCVANAKDQDGLHMIVGLW